MKVCFDSQLREAQIHVVVSLLDYSINQMLSKHFLSYLMLSIQRVRNSGPEAFSYGIRHIQLRFDEA